MSAPSRPRPKVEPAAGALSLGRRQSIGNIYRVLRADELRVRRAPVPPPLDRVLQEMAALYEYGCHLASGGRHVQYAAEVRVRRARLTLAGEEGEGAGTRRARRVSEIPALPGRVRSAGACGRLYGGAVRGRKALRLIAPAPWARGGGAR